VIAAGLVAVLLAASSNGGDAASTANVSPARDFLDVFDSAIVGDTRTLSLGVAGRARGTNRRALTVRVYRRGRTTRWQRTPRLAHPLDPAGALTLAQHDGDPCVGYQTKANAPVLACLRKDTWRQLPRAGLPGSGAQLAKLTMLGERMIAAFDVGQAPNAWTVILQLKGDRWRRLGRPIPTHGAITTVGEDYDDSNVLDVGLVDVAAGRRSIRTLSSGRWRIQPPLEGVGAGPMPGGPVRLDSRVYLPVIDASAEPWQFRVYVLDHGRWSPLGDAFNQGRGNAQGVLRINAGAVWAAWQEHAPRRDGAFDTQMYVRRLTPTPAKAERVWAGKTIGPGDIETVQGPAGQSVLYMPQRQGRQALTVRVKQLR
jgi:hypothetical protein